MTMPSLIGSAARPAAVEHNEINAAAAIDLKARMMSSSLSDPYFSYY
jgi:hypothetical protein